MIEKGVFLVQLGHHAQHWVEHGLPRGCSPPRVPFQSLSTTAGIVCEQQIPGLPFHCLDPAPALGPRAAPHLIIILPCPQPLSRVRFLSARFLTLAWDLSVDSTHSLLGKPCARACQWFLLTIHTHSSVPTIKVHKGCPCSQP